MENTDFERRVRLDIPATTFLKIFVALIVAFTLIKLFPLILLIWLSALLAFAVAPLLRWLQLKGIPRSVALGLVALSIVAMAGSFIFLLLPELFSQVSGLSQKIGPLKQEAMGHMPEGPLRNYVGKSIEHPDILFGKIPDYLAAVGLVIFNSLWSVGIFLIVSFYFMVDGRKAYQWVLGFFKPTTQSKIRKTSNQLEEIVSAYIGGQIITSLMVAVYVFALCTIIGVPGALMLAVIAAIFDVLPIIGVLATALCAFIMAMTVSPGVALLVVFLLLVYHLFETYVVVPKVYGKKMKLSTLVVLLSFIIAAPLGGVVGALLVLPVVASYPVIEKIWLRRYLGEEVVETHAEQLRETEQKDKASYSVPSLQS